MHSNSSDGPVLKGRVPFLIAIAFYTGIGNLFYGYDVATAAGVLTHETFHDRFKPPHALEGAVISIMCAGGFFGSAISGWTSDRFSRKWTMALGCLFAIVGYTLQVTSFSMAQLLVGRFIGGLSIGLMTMVVPLYCSELSPPKIRGLMVGIPGFMNSCGNIIAQWTNYGCQFYEDERQWRVPLSIQIGWALVLLCGIAFLPYTPRWLLEKGREDEARKVVHYLFKTPDVTKEEVDAAFDKMRDGVYAERLHEGRIADLWSTPDMKRRTFVACAATTFNQFTGIGVTSFYGPRIYASLGFSGNQELLIHGIYSAAAAVSNFIFVTLILDTVGRRKPLLFGNASLVCVFATLSALIASFPPGTTSDRAPQYASIVMIFLVPIVFTMSYDPTSSLLAAEVFPTHSRSVGMAVAICVNWLWNVLLTEVSPIALADIGWRYYMVFLAANTVAFFVVLFYFPETKGKTLEQIAKDFGVKTPNDTEAIESDSDSSKKPT